MLQQSTAAFMPPTAAADLIQLPADLSTASSTLSREAFVSIHGRERKSKTEARKSSDQSWSGNWPDVVVLNSDELTRRVDLPVPLEYGYLNE